MDHRLLYFIKSFIKCASGYDPPLSVKEIKKHYPEKAKFLLKDPIHLWRAQTGIELIHKEPSIEEQYRIWENWKKMPFKMKQISDKKSYELFDKNNKDHHKQIINQ